MNKFTPAMIALDLDDTLLKDDLTVSDNTVRVLRAAAARGIFIVLASGRTDNAILPYVRRLELAGLQQGRYIVCQNGASITDLHERVTIMRRDLSSEASIHAWRLAGELGLTCQVYDPDTIYVSSINEYSALDVKLTGLRQIVVDDFESFLRQPQQKMVIPGDPEVLQSLQKRLLADIGDRAVIFISKPYFLEIMPAHSGKGEALTFLAEYLHIPMTDVLAFGDSMNDESMIRTAGISVAMKNGLPYIKSLASLITDKTNDEDGIADFIEKYCLL